MIPPSLSRIDLSTLSSHLRVIATTPPWPTVQTAIANLKSQGRQSESFENDFRCVQDYFNLLSRSSGIISQALVCGLMAGRVSGAQDREQRILVGLDAIARAHRFSEKTDLEVAAILKRILRDQVVLRDFEAKVENSDLSAWKRVLEEAFSRIESSPAADIDKIKFAAWDSWLERTDLFFHARRLTEPKWNDILAVAAAVPPATLLKLDLREMTLADWSTALVTVLESKLRFPAWVAFAALLALGYRSGNWPELMNWLSHIGLFDPQDLDLACRRVEKWSRRSSAVPSRSVLIIKKASGSLVDGWFPSATTAAAAVTVEQALRLAKRPPPPPLMPSEGRIAFEMPLDQETDAQSILSFWDREPGSKPPPMYFAAEVLRKKPKGHFVIAPKSVDDLFPASTAR